jgi:hypothetical protein
MTLTSKYNKDVMADLIKAHEQGLAEAKGKKTIKKKPPQEDKPMRKTPFGNF